MAAGSTLSGRVGLVLAAVTAGVAWAGLVLNAVDVFGRTGSAVATIWILADYFTILSNFVVAVAFTMLVMRPDLTPGASALAGLALSMLLVGIVYHLLLRGLYHLTPIGTLADLLLHRATPVLVPVYWVRAVAKGRLTMRDPLIWAVFPVVYFAYAVVRGLATGHYPYPFMDVAHLGWGRALINAAVIAAGFLASGWALVWFDGMLAGRARPRA